MPDPADKLRNLLPQHNYIICIDSDGCVFDTMEIKQKECFCPHFINRFNLQPVSKYARETWEFVNLYSTTRGVNRFLALVRTLELLAERGEVTARKVEITQVPRVHDWIKHETKLGNPALKAVIDKNPNPDLETAYMWSLDVNDAVTKIVRNVPPFPYVKESLEKIGDLADAIVVSQTPIEALEREWKEHNIDGYVRVIAGQEMGTKSEHINFAAKERYKKENILMVGDAPGDYKAAKNNNALYFPINPGEEESSWERFYKEALDKFFNGTFAGEYEEMLVNEFFKHLPENPPWK